MPEPQHSPAPGDPHPSSEYKPWTSSTGHEQKRRASINAQQHANYTPHAGYSPPPTTSARQGDKVGELQFSSHRHKLQQQRHIQGQQSSSNSRAQTQQQPHHSHPPHSTTANSVHVLSAKERHLHYKQQPPQHSYSQPQSHLHSPRTLPPLSPPVQQPPLPLSLAATSTSPASPLYHNTTACYSQPTTPQLQVSTTAATTPPASVSAPLTSNTSYSQPGSLQLPPHRLQIPQPPMQQQTYTYQPQHSPGHYHQHHRHSASSVPHPYQPQHHSHNHSYSYSYNHSMPIPPPHTPHMQTSRPAGPVSSSPVTPPGIRPVFPGSRPLTAEEKEMKRKVSHSAIEKRRRERTNAVLRELQNIVPGLCKPGKIQKLEILEAAAEYIRQLSAASAIQQQPQRQQQQQKHGQQIQYHPHQQQAQPQGQQGHQPSAVHVPGRGEDVPGANLDQQHLAIATPMSVSSSATAEDSADGGPASGHSTSPPDPSSMKVNFLLC